MIKKLGMNQNALIWAILKPAMKRKFNLSELNKVFFEANQLEDTLTLSIEGFKKGILEVYKETAIPLKLSENKGYVDIFLKQVENELKKSKNVIVIKKINMIYLTIDFLNSTCNSNVYYVNGNDVKSAIQVDLKS